MPYGKPVSRRRRRRLQGSQTADSSTMVAARRIARKAAAAASRASAASDPHQTPPHVPQHRPAPLASPALLCAGHRVGVWPLRERLVLATALLDADNQQLTWPTISRRLAKFTPPSGSKFTRPAAWCSARACAKQYALLLDSAEMSRKQQVDVEKSAEEGRVVFQAPGDVAAATGTVGLSLAELIVKRLTVERVEELRNQIVTAQQKYRLIKEKIAELESGSLDDHVDVLWSLLRQQEENPSTSTSSELSDNIPPVASEFLRELSGWTDPFDVPQSVWTVSGGNGTALRSVPSVSKVTGAATTPMKMAGSNKTKSILERSPSASSRKRIDDSNVEADEGCEDGSTPSTSVMSESDLDYEEGEDAMKLEVSRCINEEPPMPVLKANVSSPKLEAEVGFSNQSHQSPAAARSPSQVDGEEDMGSQKDSFQPRSLRLRLSRQQDGNLSVITDDTHVRPPPASPSLRLRLSLSPVPSVTSQQPALKQWSTEILERAFPEANSKNALSSQKKNRSG
uniref:Bromo domain-containing protein n=1 Tax=Mesocestoides corti TaxID=53468 RepID=A0A5K3FD26_MESCO